jgi:hypothetical protein
MRYWSKQVLLFGLHGLIHPVGRPHVLVRLTVCLRFAQWLSTLARDCTRTCVGRLRHCCTEMRTRGVLYRIGGLIEYVNLVCGRNGRRGVSAEIGAALRGACRLRTLLRSVLSVVGGTCSSAAMRD